MSRKDEKFRFAPKPKHVKKDSGNMLSNLIGNGIFSKILVVAIVWFFATGVYQTGRIVYNLALRLWHFYY